MKVILHGNPQHVVPFSYLNRKFYLCSTKKQIVLLLGPKLRSRKQHVVYQIIDTTYDILQIVYSGTEGNFAIRMFDGAQSVVAVYKYSCGVWTIAEQFASDSICIQWFSKDCVLLLNQDYVEIRDVKKYSFVTGKEILNVMDKNKIQYNRFALSDDSMFLAICKSGDTLVKVYLMEDVAHNTIQYVYLAHPSEVMDVQFSNSGEYLICCGRIVYVWRLLYIDNQFVYYLCKQFDDAFEHSVFLSDEVTENNIGNATLDHNLTNALSDMKVNKMLQHGMDQHLMVANRNKAVQCRPGTLEDTFASEMRIDKQPQSTKSSYVLRWTSEGQVEVWQFVVMRNKTQFPSVQCIFKHTIAEIESASLKYTSITENSPSSLTIHMLLQRPCCVALEKVQVELCSGPNKDFTLKSMQMYPISISPHFQDISSLVYCGENTFVSMDTSGIVASWTKDAEFSCQVLPAQVDCKQHLGIHDVNHLLVYKCESRLVLHRRVGVHGEFSSEVLNENIKDVSSLYAFQATQNEGWLLCTSIVSFFDKSAQVYAWNDHAKTKTFPLALNNVDTSIIAPIRIVASKKCLAYSFAAPSICKSRIAICEIRISCDRESGGAVLCEILLGAVERSFSASNFQFICVECSENGKIACLLQHDSNASRQKICVVNVHEADSYCTVKDFNVYYDTCQDIETITWLNPADKLLAVGKNNVCTYYYVQQKHSYDAFRGHDKKLLAQLGHQSFFATTSSSIVYTANHATIASHGINLSSNTKSSQTTISPILIHVILAYISGYEGDINRILSNILAEIDDRHVSYSRARITVSSILHRQEFGKLTLLSNCWYFGNTDRKDQTKSDLKSDRADQLFQRPNNPVVNKVGTKAPSVDMPKILNCITANVPEIETLNHIVQKQCLGKALQLFQNCSQGDAAGRNFVVVSSGLGSRNWDQAATIFKFFYDADICISSYHVAWMAASQAQHLFIEYLKTHENRPQMTWNLMRELKIPLWLHDATHLVDLVEPIAKNEFLLSNKDPSACALFYVLLGKVKILSGLYRLAKQQSISDLLSNDFSQDRWKTVALKNAYVLKTKKRYMLAAAFFILGGKPVEAISLCSLADPSCVLSSLVSRMVEPGEKILFKKELKIRLHEFAQHHHDKWLLFAIYWMSGDYKLAYDEISTFTSFHQYQNDSFAQPTEPRLNFAFSGGWSVCDFVRFLWCSYPLKFQDVKNTPSEIRKLLKLRGHTIDSKLAESIVETTSELSFFTMYESLIPTVALNSLAIQDFNHYLQSRFALQKMVIMELIKPHLEYLMSQCTTQLAGSRMSNVSIDTTIPLQCAKIVQQSFQFFPDTGSEAIELNRDSLFLHVLNSPENDKLQGCIAPIFGTFGTAPANAVPNSIMDCVSALVTYAEGEANHICLDSCSQFELDGDRSIIGNVTSIFYWIVYALEVREITNLQQFMLQLCSASLYNGLCLLFFRRRMTLGICCISKLIVVLFPHVHNKVWNETIRQIPSCKNCEHVDTIDVEGRTFKSDLPLLYSCLDMMRNVDAQVHFTTTPKELAHRSLLLCHIFDSTASQLKRVAQVSSVYMESIGIQSFLDITGRMLMAWMELSTVYIEANKENIVCNLVKPTDNDKPEEDETICTWEHLGSLATLQDVKELVHKLVHERDLQKVLPTSMQNNSEVPTGGILRSKELLNVAGSCDSLGFEKGIVGLCINHSSKGLASGSPVVSLVACTSKIAFGVRDPSRICSTSNIVQFQHQNEAQHKIESTSVSMDQNIENITSIASHPELPLFVTGTSNGMLRIWNFDDTSAPTVQVWNSDNKMSSVSRIQVEQQDGLEFATCSAHELRVWHFETTQCYANVQPKNAIIRDFCFLNDSSCIATVGQSSINQTLCLWDTYLPPSKSLVCTFDTHGGGHNAASKSAISIAGYGGTKIVFSATHQLIISGGESGDISVFDLRHRRVLHTVKSAHGGTPISMLELHPTNNCIMSGSTTGDFKLWSVPIFRELVHVENIHGKASFFTDLSTTASSVVGTTSGVLSDQAMYTGGANGSLQLHTLLHHPI